MEELPDQMYMYCPSNYWSLLHIINESTFPWNIHWYLHHILCQTSTQNSPLGYICLQYTTDLCMITVVSSNRKWLTRCSSAWGTTGHLRGSSDRAIHQVYSTLKPGTLLDLPMATLCRLNTTDERASCNVCNINQVMGTKAMPFCINNP